MTVSEVALHHHAPPSPSRRTFLLLYARNPIFHLHCRPISVSDRRFLLFPQWSLHILRCRRWDSNAESYSTKNFNFDATDEIEDFEDEMEQWVDALEDYIDSIWILKVFGSYGWMLPPILLSLLLATGLKAFLMALALPVGQSTLSFAIQRFQNSGTNKWRPKNKNKAKKRRSRFYSSRDAGLEESPEFTSSRGARKKQKGYQSWVSKDESTVSSNESNDRTATNFGGWDELDTGINYNVGSSRRASKNSTGSRGTSARKGEKRRLSESDGPLLLRLLISMFPFMSSWTKML